MNRSFPPLAAGLAVFASLLLGACETVSTTGSGIPPAPIPGTLAPGDVIRITYVSAPELNQTQKIGADGNINLPMIGTVHAGGMRMTGLQQHLTSRYKPHLKDAEVVVSIETSGTSFYVSGAVLRPGRIALDRPMTVLEGIMEAGGFTSGLGNPHKVVLIRTVGGSHTTRVVDLAPALRGEMTGAIYLKQNDVIYVHERFF